MRLDIKHRDEIGRVAQEILRSKGNYLAAAMVLTVMVEMGYYWVEKA